MVTKTQETESKFLGATIPFGRISEPGTYFCNWSGHLLRVPEDAVKRGRSPVIEILGAEQIQVTKLSNDPFLPVTKARMVAADLDHTVNF
jgi:hypothetical protein